MMNGSQSILNPLLDVPVSDIHRTRETFGDLETKRLGDRVALQENLATRWERLKRITQAKLYLVSYSYQKVFHLCVCRFRFRFRLSFSFRAIEHRTQKSTWLWWRETKEFWNKKYIFCAFLNRKNAFEVLLLLAHGRNLHTNPQPIECHAGKWDPSVALQFWI